MPRFLHCHHRRLYWDVFPAVQHKMLTSVLFLFRVFVLLSDSAIPDDQAAPIVHAILQSAVQMLESMTCKDINKIFILKLYASLNMLYADAIMCEIL